jgi:ABC-type branched-subunit amino acid transport system substrate-binding protein
VLAAAEEAPPLRIGVITPLTGQLATIGTAVRNGIELARREQPELVNGVGFAYEDDQADPKQSIDAYLKHLSSRKGEVIFGFGTTL